MSKTLYAKAFNNHLIEFFDDLLLIFPDNNDIEMGKVSFKTLQRSTSLFQSKPSDVFLKLWYSYSYDYHKQIKDGDISFFLNKDYTNDINKMTSGYNSYAEEILNKIRKPIISLEDKNKQKAMKYIQNLTELSTLYMTEKN